jgi:hypothetical protein
VIYPSLNLSKPAFKDLDGNTIDKVAIGQQIIIVETIHNDVYDETKPMVGIIEVRDELGVTLDLAWQTMTIDPNGNYTFGTSWTAKEAAPGGVYLIRALAISSLDESADALSSVFESRLRME